MLVVDENFMYPHRSAEFSIVLRYIVHVPGLVHAEDAVNWQLAEFSLATAVELHSIVVQAASLHACSFTLSEFGSEIVAVAFTDVEEPAHAGVADGDVGVLGCEFVPPEAQPLPPHVIAE